MIYLAMSAAKQMLTAQGVVSNNLANANTTGFKADLAAFRTMPVFGDGYPSRVYAMTERPGVDFKTGTIETTGNDLDVAINGNGFIAVQAPDGTEAYTRVGEFKQTVSGQLVTASGQPVLGNGGPIAIPPAESLVIGDDGTISIRPVGQAANTLAQVDRIKLVNPEVKDLVKGEDGLYRLKNGASAAPDASVRIVRGALERSNVNTVNEMIGLIQNQRQYEMAVKAMQTAQEIDSAGERLLRLS